MNAAGGRFEKAMNAAAEAQPGDTGTLHAALIELLEAGADLFGEASTGLASVEATVDDRWASRSPVRDRNRRLSPPKG